MRSFVPATLLAAVVLAGCGTQPDLNSADVAPSTPATSPPPPAPPAPRAAEVNKQDRVSAAHKRRESRAMDQRPLLDQLPVTVGEVTISIGGLADDNKTTVITIDPGAGSDEDALAVYRDLLHAHDDSGQAYEPQVIR